MKLSKANRIGMAMTFAMGGRRAVAAPGSAGTVLGGATVTNGARGTMPGKVVDGPATVILPGAGQGQFDIMAANINLPARGGGIDWHTHPGPTYGIVTGGGTLTISDDNCVAREYETGDSFVAPRNPHTARNYSADPVTVRASFYLPHTAPATPPTEFVTQLEDDLLDGHCGLSE